MGIYLYIYIFIYLYISPIAKNQLVNFEIFFLFVSRDKSLLCDQLALLIKNNLCLYWLYLCYGFIIKYSIVTTHFFFLIFILISFY